MLQRNARQRLLNTKYSAAELAAKADDTISELVGHLNELIQASEEAGWHRSTFESAKEAIDRATLASLPAAELLP